MQCKRISEKKNQAGEFVIEVDFSELSILSMGTAFLTYSLESGLSIPMFGKFPNDMDEESRQEMKEVADQVMEELDILQNSVLDDEK
jgi:hypothetical protein